MAGEKAGTGASSSSRPRRSSRNAADGKQIAPRVAADGKKTAIRVAGDGKQSPLRVAAASDGKRMVMGVSVDAASTTLHPIDLRSDVAPAEGRTEVAKFVHNFYCALNFNLLGLYRFYADDAEFVWNFNGRRLNLKTAKEIRSYLYRASTKMKFHASHFDLLSIPGQSSVMLTVYGTIKSADNKPRSFVETFVLDIPGRLILRDSLVVQENALEVPEVSSPKKFQDHTASIMSTNDSQNHCGICNKKWYPLEKDWVCCDRCQMWLHVECDPNCSRDMEKVEKSEYFCPGCTSECKDVLTLSTLKQKSPEPIIVSCAGKEGVYKPIEKMIECRCKICLKNLTPVVMSTNVWEKHTGCRQKNWKKSIKLKGTEKPLFKLLEEIPEGTGISSIASEIQQVSSVDTSDQPAAETSDQPAAETSYQKAAETSELAAVTSDQTSASLSYVMSGNKSQKSKVCILHDYDRMKSHQDKDTDHKYEKASRISEIMNTLNQDGVLDRTEREPFDSADREIILAIHDPEQLDYVDDLPLTDEEQDAKFSKVAGVSVFSSEGTTEAIYSAAGAVIRGSDLVVEEYYETAFAIIRPPGHHAYKISEGFCFLNNVGIAIQHVVDHHLRYYIVLFIFQNYYSSTNRFTSF
ncbi:uncharacterized protein LOC119270095 isoform X2 [Triticum dicoccoides]|uniref:uncharacterized protein LOC119270095 isoform X2 n=1 Tax=Triticum dicoccoides TaxID=85692 RepID=UPI000E7CA6AB|nr:uncharacterized protein LOC119270095 isoform X2 [Triticum dicoccoides]